MPFDLIQPSLNGGEVSPSLYGRVDLALYAKSLRTCRNFIPVDTGGVENRAGTKFIDEVKDSSAATRLIPFEFSKDVSYVLEFGNQYIRFYKDGVLLESGGSPYEVTTPYTTADLDDIAYTQSADVMTLVHPDYGPRELARSGDTSWTLTKINFEEGPFRAINTDESIIVWSSGETGKVTLTASDSIFESGHAGGLFYMEARNLAEVEPWESNKQIAVSGGSVTNPLGQLRRNSEGNVYRCVTDQTATASGEIETGTREPTHLEGVAADGDGNQITAGGTVYAERAGVEWEYLHGPFGIVRLETINSGTEAEGTVVKRLPKSVVSSSALTTVASGTGDGSTVTYSLSAVAATDPTDESQYRVTVVTTIDDPEPGAPNITYTQIYSTDKYTITTGPDEITFDEPLTSDQTFTVEVFEGSNTTDFWAHVAWSGEYGYPSTVAYFADRLTFSNNASEPQTTWMSKTGDYHNFGKSTPLIDSDAITFTINARQINPIYDLVPMGNLILMTPGKPWKMTAGQDQIVAPATVGAQPQRAPGAGTVRSVDANDTVIYAQKHNARLHDLAYTFEVDGYRGRDLTVLARHLFNSKSVVDMDWQESPYGILWVVLDDGSLVSLTYLREEGVVAWARHDSGDDSFERVVVVPEGGRDAVYVLVNRTINGATKRYVERVQERLISSTDDWWFLDSALQYDGENTDVADTLALSGGSTWASEESLTITASGHAPFTSASVGDIMLLESGADSVRVRVTAYTSTTVVTGVALKDVPASLQGTAVSTWTYQADTISGLSHLEGREVNVLADGNVQSSKTVSGGSITLDNPAGKVLVGIGYNADIETLDLNVAGGESTRRKVKNVPSVGILVESTRGIYAGESEDKLYEAKLRTYEDYDESIDLKTGLIDVSISSTWNKGGRVLLRNPDPVPSTILSVIPEVEIGGS